MDLLSAYRSTRYTVGDGAGWFLTIDQPCVPLARLMSRHGVSCAAYLTACNPQSRVLSDAENALASRQLRQRLERGGWAIYRGRALTVDDSWPAEESYLVPGLIRRMTVELGRQFNQLAVLWCSRDAIARLIWCDQGAGEV
jgi:hypothetical protein